MKRPLQFWQGSSLRRLASIASAAMDPRAPVVAKVAAIGTVVYALSPIDIIPDFIPVIGWIDDAAIVALGLWVVSKTMPAGLLEEHYERVQGRWRWLS